MRMKNFLFAFVCLSLCPAARAADTNAAAVSITGACRADLRKLCRPAPAGGPLKCLLDHKDSVEPGCRKALDGLKGAAVPQAPSKGQPKSCLPEYTKVCAGMKSKDFKACLKEHRKELSPACQKAAEAAL
jgi:hypothetical protein